MDTVPYDFVDRVFTRLSAIEHRTLDVKAPLWAEAVRVYKKKVELFKVEIILNPDGCRYKFISFKSSRDWTLQEMATLDDRFIRIDQLRVFGVIAVDHGHYVEDLPKLIQFISRFPVEDMNLYLLSAETHQGLMDACVDSSLRIRSLQLLHCRESEEFLKCQLHSDELSRLDIQGDIGPELMSDFESFVCRPTFQFLHCNFTCMDMDCLKRIVAYWKAMESPWSKATLSLKTRKQLNTKFATWLPWIFETRIDKRTGNSVPCKSAPRQFEERNGLFCLRVLCRDNHVLFEFFSSSPQ